MIGLICGMALMALERVVIQGTPPNVVARPVSAFQARSQAGSETVARAISVEARSNPVGKVAIARTVSAYQASALIGAEAVARPISLENRRWSVGATAIARQVSLEHTLITGELVLPSGYQVVRGVEQGGNDVQKIRDDDDVYAVIQQRFQFSPTLANAELLATLSVPSGNPITAALVTVRAKSNSLPFSDPSCIQEIALRDWGTGTLAVVNSRKPENPSQGEPAINISLSAGDRSRFIRQDGRVEVAVRVYHLSPLSAAWTLSVDQIVLTVAR